MAGTHVSDGAYEQVRNQFSDEELAELTFLTGTTNLWDRLAVGFRLFQPKQPRPTDTRQALPPRASFEPASANKIHYCQPFRQEKELQKEA